MQIENMKKLLIKFVFVFAAITIFSLASNAQNSSRDLTWEELREIHARERESLQNVQKSELNVLNLAHKEENELVRGNSGSAARLNTEHAAERKETLKNHQEERKHQLEIQSAERRIFIKPKIN